MDQKTDMQIVKTTDYFNMTKEEAAEMKNEYDWNIISLGLMKVFAKIMNQRNLRTM